MTENMLEFEQKYWDMGYRIVAGVDEAGRGPLAGAVYAAAVVFEPGMILPEVDDSKKLSEKRRGELAELIKEKALCWAVASVDEKEIDRINILNAAIKAFGLALDALEVKPEFAIIDGNRAKGLQYPYETIVKGDARSQSIAAASILAKVARDNYIVKMDEVYPEYGFAKHKGYPTKEHKAAVEKYGPCPIHRLTFTGVREHVR